MFDDLHRRMQMKLEPGDRTPLNRYYDASFTAPARYGRDWTRRWTPAPLAIALPGTVAEVQQIVRWANAHRVGLVPSGGRTGGGRLGGGGWGAGASTGNE